MTVGDSVLITGKGDLMMDRSKGRFIGKEGVIVQVTKAGLYVVSVDGENTPPLPKRNLSIATPKPV